MWEFPVLPKRGGKWALLSVPWVYSFIQMNVKYSAMGHKTIYQHDLFHVASWQADFYSNGAQGYSSVQSLHLVVRTGTTSELIFVLLNQFPESFNNISQCALLNADHWSRHRERFKADIGHIHSLQRIRTSQGKSKLLLLLFSL